MPGKQNCFVLQRDIILVISVIIFQCLRVHVRAFPFSTTNDPVVLLSWGDIPLVLEAPLIPEHCQPGGLCENVENYPTELVAMIMRELRQKNITSFANDELSKPEYSNELDDIEDLCQMNEEKIIYPRAAKDLDGQWHFILNTPRRRRNFQSFRVQECLASPQLSCSNRVHVRDISYVLECEQTFTRREMVYLNLERKVVETGYFGVPSCCSCYLTPKRTKKC